MLTINRPYYEYRDIYLFIAVGLAAFITTFIVLGIVTTINTNQLSQSTQKKESPGTVYTTDKKNSGDSSPKSAESGASSDQNNTAPQQRHSNTNPQSSSEKQQAPVLQSPAISSPVKTNPTPNYSDSALPQTVIVQQPVQSVPTPPDSNPQQQNDSSDSLVDVSLPLGIKLNLL